MKPPEAKYAISMRQPYAWLVAAGLRPLDNRTWSTMYRGEIYIHAGVEPIEYEDFARDVYRRKYGIELPERFDYGGIIGRARITGCTTFAERPWFEGPYAILFADASLMPFIPCKGVRYLFRCEEKIKLAKRSLRANRTVIC